MTRTLGSPFDPIREVAPADVEREGGHAVDDEEEAEVIWEFCRCFSIVAR